MLLSSSRDKTLIIWNLTRDETSYGYPKRSLHGHSHIVSDCVISSDGAYALSASWDKTLRLWELSTGVTTRRFVGHTNDVLSVSFSADNRQIVSGSRDRTIKLWNTLGDCKFTITDKGHTEWVSCVRFSPNPQNPVIVSAGWDKLVKVSSRILSGISSSKPNDIGERLKDAKITLSICYFRALGDLGHETNTSFLMISPYSASAAFTRASNYVMAGEDCRLTGAIYNRCGSSLRAAFRLTISVILDTSTPSPFHPTARSVLREERTGRRCCGISTSRNTYTRSPLATKFTRLFSRPTGTGFVPRHHRASLSSISRRRARWMS